MPFLSLFSCCASESSQKRFPNKPETEVETDRNVRIVYQRNPSRNSDLPPRYSEIVHNQARVVDEKDATSFLVVDEVERSESRSESQRPRSRGGRGGGTDHSPTRSVSDGSSVVSVPSTRLSGLTSTYTGTTNRTRILEDGDSPPPSYYAGSVGEDMTETEQVRHPVMDEGWLDRLRDDAERRLRGQEADERP